MVWGSGTYGCATGSDGSAGHRSAAGAGCRAGEGGACAAGSWVSAGRAGGTALCSSVSSAVLRKRSASGPSRIDARLPVGMSEDLLGELPVGMGGHAVGIVFEH